MVIYTRSGQLTFAPFQKVGGMALTATNKQTKPIVYKAVTA